jgi:hypothetical protein
VAVKADALALTPRSCACSRTREGPRSTILRDEWQFRVKRRNHEIGKRWFDVNNEHVDLGIVATNKKKNPP